MFRDVPLLTRAWKDGFAANCAATLSIGQDESPLPYDADELLIKLEQDSRCELDGYHLSADSQGVWMTNPWGLDCGLFPLTANGCAKLLSFIENTRGQIKEWGTL